ncbi:hypothetical protein Y1Q_0015119 [Alligator mississippiensis]|uniref:Uncharacterized protein n=1 Tax=Alligator mississippiensis TaxID=8496 RepID=A0A151P8T8_ALLMI|nr:hypothetical protein Y1Q_0015119 [Alligator mississippiensis]
MTFQTSKATLLRFTISTWWNTMVQVTFRTMLENYLPLSAMLLSECSFLSGSWTAGIKETLAIHRGYVLEIPTNGEIRKYVHEHLRSVSVFMNTVCWQLQEPGASGRSPAVVVGARRRQA